jgi:hypothetical protein
LADPGKVPGAGVDPGVPNGLLEEGLDGVLGAEKLRLPRLPEEPPPPALAHALDSRTIQNTKHSEIKSPRETYNLFLVFISILLPFSKLRSFHSHPTPMAPARVWTLDYSVR